MPTLHKQADARDDHADILHRPFIRRRRSTRRPFLVLIRCKNPCRRFLTRLLGWYVLLVLHCIPAPLLSSTMTSIVSVVRHGGTISNTSIWWRCGRFPVHGLPPIPSIIIVPSRLLLERGICASTCCLLSC